MLKAVFVELAYVLAYGGLVALAFLGPAFALMSLALILWHVWRERRAFLK